MSLHLDTIIELGRANLGDDKGKIIYQFNREKLLNLSNGDIGILHAMLNQCLQRVASEYNFRHMKTAPPIPETVEPPKETP